MVLRVQYTEKNIVIHAILALEGTENERIGSEQDDLTFHRL